MMYSNASMYIAKFVNPGMNYIHDIQVRYVTSNMYFIKFVIPGFNRFVMPGVNYIYEMINYKKSLVF